MEYVLFTFYISVILIYCVPFPCYIFAILFQTLTYMLVVIIQSQFGTEFIHVKYLVCIPCNRNGLFFNLAVVEISDNSVCDGCHIYT
jgi:hypothetical protein